MATDMPVEILVYDKAFGFRGWVGRPNHVEVIPRHNLMSTATFTLDSDHDRVPDLMATGARVEIYRHGVFEMSGVVKQAVGTFAIASELTFSVHDDFRILHNWLAWPVPTAALTAQNVAYRSITGNAETVAKTIALENATRLGFPLTVGPNLGRGASGLYTFRFHPLYDRLFPAVDQAGIGVTVKQNGNGLVLDVYEPRTYPHRLSVEAGTIKGGTYSIAAPTATRVVVGGQGEGVAREFKGFADAPRETAWGDVVEVMQDARDSSVGDVYAARAAEVLAEGAPTSGLSLELSETPHFAYGQNLYKGDTVTALIGGQLFTDTLREAKLSWGEGGEQSTPLVGDRTDDPNVTLAKQLRALKRDNKDRMAR